MKDQMGQEIRLLEAMLFAALEPVDEATLAARLPAGCDVAELLGRLAEDYAGRGVNLTRVAGKWALRTAEDLSAHLTVETKVPRRLSRAAVETLSIIAYHQPVTRTEVEEIRGVAMSRGTLDTLLEAGWIRPVGRRRTPGRPMTWGTSPAFLDHFGLNSVADLPGIDELKAAGLLDTRPVTTIFGEVALQDEPSAADEPEDVADAADEGQSQWQQETGGEADQSGPSSSTAPEESGPAPMVARKA